MKIPSVKTSLFAAALTMIVALLVLIFTSCPKRTALAFEMQSAEASQGCGYAFGVLQSFWNAYPHAAIGIYHNEVWSGYLTPGDLSLHGLSNGDEISIENATGCITSTINWGYTVFTHCTVSEQPQLQSVYPCLWILKKATVVCHCAPPVNVFAALTTENLVDCNGQ